MNKKIFKIAASLALVSLAILVTLTGCGSTAVASGWAGVSVSGDNLYTVSSLGELGALTLANGNALWNLAVDTTPASSGALGCSSPSTVVAVYGNLAISGDFIYIAGYNGKVYTFSATTRLSSSVTLDQDDSKPIVGGPVADQGKVYVASSNGNLYALDATTLAEVWKFKTGNKIWSTPAVDNGTVFIGSFDKKVYAVTAAGNEKWSFATQGAIVATPVVDNGIVYVASFDRHVYALDEATGALKWQFPAAGQTANAPGEWFWATPVIANGILYAPCLDGKVYAINTADSSKVTVFDLGKAISSSPAVFDGKVIVATEDGKIYSLDAGNNQKIELKDLKLSVRSSLTAFNGVVYVHTQQSEAIYAINAATGAVLWYMPIAG